MFDHPKKKKEPTPHNTHASDYTSLLKDFPQLKGMIGALAKKDQEAKKHIKDDIMFDNVKKLTERGGNSGLFNRDGTMASAPPGAHNPDDPEENKPVPLEKPTKPSPMTQRIRDANRPPTPPPSAQNRLIRNQGGKIVGAVGSKVRINSATEIVVKNIIQEIAPVEEMMTGSVAVIPTPMGASAIPTPMVAPQMQPKLCPCGSGKSASQCCNQQTIKVHDAINTTMRNAPVDRGSRLRRITNVLGGL